VPSGRCAAPTGAAVGSRTWEGMVKVGDAYRRVREAPEARGRGRAKHIWRPWFRARQQGSLPGVFRAAEGFAALGDREPVSMCIRVARELAVRFTDAGKRERAGQPRTRAISARRRSSHALTAPLTVVTTQGECFIG
jgi:hypothetical protein